MSYTSTSWPDLSARRCRLTLNRHGRQYEVDTLNEKKTLGLPIHGLVALQGQPPRMQQMDCRCARQSRVVEDTTGGQVVGEILHHPYLRDPRSQAFGVQEAVLGTVLLRVLSIDESPLTSGPALWSIATGSHLPAFSFPQKERVIRQLLFDVGSTSAVPKEKKHYGVCGVESMKSPILNHNNLCGSQWFYPLRLICNQTIQRSVNHVPLGVVMGHGSWAKFIADSLAMAVSDCIRGSGKLSS